MAFTVHPRSFYGFAEDLILTASGGVWTDDSELDPRLVISWIRDAYATVLEEDIRRAEAEQLEPNPLWLTNFPCVSLKKVDYTGCDCTSAGCSIKKLDLPIGAVSFYNKPLIGYLGLVGFSREFDQVDSDDPLRFLRTTGGRFGLKGGTGGYFIVGQDVYVVLPNNMRAIKQLALSVATSDPTQDKISVDGSVIVCGDFDKLPYPDSYFARIREKVWPLLTRELQTIQLQDKTNNADSR